jgi:hypothetical protein
MKKTIKSLEAELVRVQEDRDRYLSKYYSLSEKVEREKHEKMMMLKSDRDELGNQVRNLLEVVRWLIKPSTAESPFAPTKDQRDENIRRF